MKSMNPLSNMPNAMTMSKACKFGSVDLSALQYPNMDSPAGNPINSYMGNFIIYF